MKEFSALTFKEDEGKTNDARSRRYNFGYVVFLTFALYYFFMYLEWRMMEEVFLAFALLSMPAFCIITAGKIPSFGTTEGFIRLTSTSLYINDLNIEIKDKGDLEIWVQGYKGQPFSNRFAIFETHNGNDNFMHLTVDEKKITIQFVLNTKRQREKLRYFCSVHGFENIRGNYLL